MDVRSSVNYIRSKLLGNDILLYLSIVCFHFDCNYNYISLCNGQLYVTYRVKENIKVGFYTNNIALVYTSSSLEDSTEPETKEPYSTVPTWECLRRIPIFALVHQLSDGLLVSGDSLLHHILHFRR